jgi:hypothetical protein
MFPPFWGRWKPRGYIAAADLVGARNIVGSWSSAPLQGAHLGKLPILIAAAVSRSLRYQNGLMESTSMSIGIASILLQGLRDDDELILRTRDGHEHSVIARQVGGVLEQAVRVHTVLTRLPLTMSGRRRSGTCLQHAERNSGRGGCFQEVAARRHSPPPAIFTCIILPAASVPSGLFGGPTAMIKRHSVEAGERGAQPSCHAAWRCTLPEITPVAVALHRH